MASVLFTAAAGAVMAVAVWFGVVRPMRPFPVLPPRGGRR